MREIILDNRDHSFINHLCKGAVNSLSVKREFYLKILLFSTLWYCFYFPSKSHADEVNKNLSNIINQEVFNEPELNGALAGVSIRSGKDGRILYDHMGDIRLRPASNLKLLTAAAALSVLGENHTFTTEVLFDGSIKKSTLNGNIYLKGKGDPTLLKSDLNKLAEEIKKKGISKIHGDIIGDNIWFDNVRYSVDLPWSDETAYYGAQISALTASPTTDYDAGTVRLEIKPGRKIGAKTKVYLTPKTNVVKIVNNSVTVNADNKKKIKIYRKHAKNTIIIDGTLPVNGKGSREWVAVWDPARYALDLFYQGIVNQGIELTGKMKIENTPQSGQLLISHHSMPLSDMLIPFMKLSNNGHAEVLVKEMGKVKMGEGSWEKGLKVLKTQLPKWGVNPKTMVIRDGSGVSHVNLIPANEITQLLFKIQEESWFPAYANSLPIAGEQEKLLGGSLRHRLKSPLTRGKIKAKTGSLSTVSSLSGYVDTKSGRTLIFSILLNNLIDETWGKKIEDKIVTILANQ